MNETTMTMVGRLVDKPQRWNVENGPKATFRLARSERRFDKDLGAWIDGATLFLGVSCWRVLAERVLAALGKGDPVVVRGRLRTREWEKDGKRHSVVELEATSVGPDLASCSAFVVPRSPAAQPVEPEREGADGGDAGATDASWNTGPLVDDPWLEEPERVEAAVGG